MANDAYWAAAVAHGSLLTDPMQMQLAWGAASKEPLRLLAWDEDATTLAIDAVRGLPEVLPHVEWVFLPEIVDAETFRVAAGLDRAEIFVQDDHTAAQRLARGLAGTGLIVVVNIPFDPREAGASAYARAEAWGSRVARLDGMMPPREVAQPTLAVSPTRALLESRALVDADAVPDSPMGAYVPVGTWLEDLPARLRLIAQRCASCARVMYPPRGACPACRERRFEPVALPQRALVYAFTRIGRGGAPSEFALEQEQVGAYWVAVVEWPDEKVRVTARLAGFDEPRIRSEGDAVPQHGGGGPSIGQAVRPVVRRLFDQEGKSRYGVKFAPA